MADVAEAAGISRATLYVHFKDKDALLLSLAHSVFRESLQQMRDAWQPGSAFGANVEATILAKDLPLHRLKHTSPHGGELFDSSSEMVVACATKLEAGFIETQREASLAIFNFIEGWYNPHRRHSALGYLSPYEYERRMSEAA